MVNEYERDKQHFGMDLEDAEAKWKERVDGHNNNGESSMSKVHPFSDADRKKYEVLAEKNRSTNPHFDAVLTGNGWHDREGHPVCWYCGSLNPDHLLELFRSGKVVGFSGSDWKYGWPHKFYIDIDTGKPGEYYYEINGEQVDKAEYDKACADRNYRCNEFGGRSMGSGRVEGTGVFHAKFYNEHIVDVRPEDLEELCSELEKRFHIRFSISPKGLMYRAPRPGYQTWSGRETTITESRGLRGETVP